MIDFVNLINYIKNKKNKLLEEYNINMLLDELNILQSNLNYLKTNLIDVDGELLKKLLLEKYNLSEVEKKISLFEDIKKLEKYFETMKDESQIIFCLNMLNEFKQLFEEKISLLNSDITAKRDELNLKTSLLDKYLSYFDNNNLVSVISLEEIEQLIDFIINSNIDNKFDILKLLGKTQIQIYQQQINHELSGFYHKVRRNEEHVRRVIEQENQEEVEEELIVSDEHETSPLDNLSEEEKEIYNQILEILEILKNENLKRPNEELEYIQIDDDYSLNSREDVYNRDTIWSIVYYDLKENLLPNLIDNKQLIIEIFKYIINIYKEKFIKKSDFDHKLSSTININQVSILRYLKLLNNLPQTLRSNLKNMKHSMEIILESEGIEGLANANFGISLEEINFYLKIEDLEYYFESFNEVLKQDMLNDINIANTIINNLKEIQEEIETVLSELKEFNLDEPIIEEENIAEVSPKFVNLPIMFPTINKNIHDASIDIVEELKKNYTERAKMFMEQNIDDLKQMLLMYPFNEIKIRSKKGNNKSHNQRFTNPRKQNISRPKFDEYDVFRYKHELATSGRVVYMMLHISDNNKLRLQRYFNLENLENICLVLNFDAAVGSDHDYGARSYQILVKNEEYIKGLIELFKNDFPTEEHFDKAVSLINDSIAEIDLLEKEYCKNANNVQIGGANNEI